jgi:hypothetical protein
VAFGRAGMLDVLDAHGAPVLAGPPKVAPGGVAFASQTAESVADAIRVFEAEHTTPPADLRALAERFATPRFHARFLQLARRVAGDR